MVTTKEELKRAIESGQKEIEVSGPLAESIRKKAQVKKAAKVVSVIAIVGGVLALPFTGGASAGAIGAGTLGLTVGAISISTSELALIVGGGLALYGLSKGYDVEYDTRKGKVILKKR